MEEFPEGGINIYEYTESADCLELEPDGHKLIVYPNPAKYYLSISSPLLLAGDNTLTLFDTAGKILLEISIIERLNFYHLDVSEIPTGIYFLKLKNEQFTATQKIMISR